MNVLTTTDETETNQDLEDVQENFVELIKSFFERRTERIGLFFGLILSRFLEKILDFLGETILPALIDFVGDFTDFFTHSISILPIT